MTRETGIVFSQLLWACVLVFFLFGAGTLINHAAARNHEYYKACLDQGGVIGRSGDCVPVVQK